MTPPTHPDVRDEFPLDSAALQQLHDRLVTDAAEADALDLTYRTVDTPVGELLLAATSVGLVRVAFHKEGLDEVLVTLADRISPRILQSPRRLENVVRQLDEYFAGQRESFELPLDHRLSVGFRRHVQRYLGQIRFGQTVTYKQVAQQVGNPNAVRAVGTACATNPLPVVVPCHRVLRSDGALGGYIGGLTAKSTLLDLERAA